MNENKYLTISQFTRIIKNNIESSYPFIFLRGEISNLRSASSGNWYFVLKDENASIKAIIFKNVQSSILNSVNSNESSILKDGQEVLVEGRISLYERSGEYSIIINKLIPVGIGELAVKFELLKEKLSKQGFFDPAIKKELPKYPLRIGIITSPTTAALQDILNVLKRRFATIKITVFPAGVQGGNAKNEIVKAIECANYHYINNTTNKVDVIIIARGGGSIEDLWPFNEEIVAHAIHNSQIPIITGIGHEIDFTIADFCADLRAPTPSAAAEIVVKNSEDLINSIAAFSLRMGIAFNNYLEKIMFRYEQCNTQRLLTIFERLYQNNLQDFSYLEDKMQSLFNENYNNLKQKYIFLIQRLNNLSPLKTLSRGYSLVLDQNNNLIKSYSQVLIGNDLSVLLSEGELSVTVTDVLEKSDRLINR